jgi:hypothetical protein
VVPAPGRHQETPSGAARENLDVDEVRGVIGNFIDELRD